jgi:hypothetical protein
MASAIGGLSPAFRFRRRGRADLEPHMAHDLAAMRLEMRIVIDALVAAGERRLSPRLRRHRPHEKKRRRGAPSICHFGRRNYAGTRALSA